MWFWCVCMGQMSCKGVVLKLWAAFGLLFCCCGLLLACFFAAVDCFWLAFSGLLFCCCGLLLACFFCCCGLLLACFFAAVVCFWLAFLLLWAASGLLFCCCGLLLACFFAALHSALHCNLYEIHWPSRKIFKNMHVWMLSGLALCYPVIHHGHVTCISLLFAFGQNGSLVFLCGILS